MAIETKTVTASREGHGPQKGTNQLSEGVKCSVLIRIYLFVKINLSVNLRCWFHLRKLYLN